MRGRIGTASAAAVLLVATLAACGPSPAPAPPPTASSRGATPFPTSAAVGCTVIATDPPEDGDLTVRGRVSFGGASRVLQLAPEPARPGQYFGKAGLGVRTGLRWRIAVPAAASSDLHVGWGSPPDFATAVAAPPDCDAPPGARWVHYPGGFEVARPGCYPLDVEVDGRTTRVRIGLGVPCTAS